MTSKTVVYETIYGVMKFPSLKKAEEFKKSICSWDGFTVETAPDTIQEAVEYHLAMEKGGIVEVYALLRTRASESKIRADIARAERETRYHLASLAPRDSIFYREHFDQSHPSYRYGT